MFLGVAFGLCCSLGLKHSHLASYPHIESCIVALVAYTSYFFSNGLSMSGASSSSSPSSSSFSGQKRKSLGWKLMTGIVSLLFCGITLKHYAYHTMSRRTQKTTKYMFAVLAQLSENFIFIYLGLNLFTQDVQVFKPLFILVSAVSPSLSSSLSFLLLSIPPPLLSCHLVSSVFPDSMHCLMSLIAQLGLRPSLAMLTL
jgi:sodium/hydrogen exchanger-like protein 6/7